MKEQNTCCYIYHVELDELRKGLKNMNVKSSLHFNDECECRCSSICLHTSQSTCGASSKVYKGITYMWHMIVCEKPKDEEWHEKKCLYGYCSFCGVDKFPFCPIEINGSTEALIEWRRFAMETTESRVGKTLKKFTWVIYKITTNDGSVQYLRPKLQNFVRHNFVSRWQDMQFKSSIKSFPSQIMVFVVDFVESYTFETQNEGQSMHWHNYQINILVHITYRHNPHPNPYDEESLILTKYQFYIFDDQKHDSEFVQHCFKLH